MPAVMSVGLVGNLLSIRVLKSTNIDMKVRFSSTSTFSYEIFRENTRATQWVTFSGTVPTADNSLWRESCFFARIFALILALLLWVDGLVIFFDKVRDPLHQMWWRCQVSRIRCYWLECATSDWPARDTKTCTIRGRTVVSHFKSSLFQYIYLKINDLLTETKITEIEVSQT